MWSARKRLAGPLLPLFLAGCGFAPVYGDHSQGTAFVDDGLATVKVSQIGDRLGVILTDHLRDSFNPNGLDVTPQYQLTVTLSETQNGIATRSDGTAAWVDISMKADWSLRRLKDGKVVTSGTSAAISGSGQLQDNYANIVSTQADERRDLDQLQADIQTRVALMLKDGAEAS